MPTLYKVTLKAKQIVSRYDKRGAKISESSVELEHTIGGLPHVTAMSYRDISPDCVIVVDDSFTGSRETMRAREPRRSPAGTAAKTRCKPAPVPAKAGILAGGDYADLVNKLSEKEAA